MLLAMVTSEQASSLNFVDEAFGFVFGVFLGIAIARLHFAFDLIGQALCLQSVVTDDLASDLLDVSLGLLNAALDLVFVHDVSFEKFKNSKLPSAKATC
jgi:hypothetical protein